MFVEEEDSEVGAAVDTVVDACCPGWELAYCSRWFGVMVFIVSDCLTQGKREEGAELKLCDVI